MNQHPYVVTSPCIGTKDTACAKVCPIPCFYNAGEMLMISQECICCGLCVPECPVGAIFPMDQVPENECDYINRSTDFFAGKSADELEKLRVNP